MLIKKPKDVSVNDKKYFTDLFLKEANKEDSKINYKTVEISEVPTDIPIHGKYEHLLTKFKFHLDNGEVFNIHLKLYNKSDEYLNTYMFHIGIEDGIRYSINYHVARVVEESEDIINGHFSDNSEALISYIFKDIINIFNVFIKEKYNFIDYLTESEYFTLCEYTSTYHKSKFKEFSLEDDDGVMKKYNQVLIIYDRERLDEMCRERIAREDKEKDELLTKLLEYEEKLAEYEAKLNIN